ncbi:MAG: tRNA guanosine(34) transglycosylase Tgt [Patescibacteria group bacterium]
MPPQTNRWADRSVAAWQNKSMALYGMVQGSIYEEQRRRSAEYLRDMPFRGFAIGGNMYTFGKEMNAIEREKGIMWDVVQFTTSLLPEEKPRHLLGVGEPSDVVAGVRAGIDTFDCVMATRLARHGGAWIRTQHDSWQYQRINLAGAQYARDGGVLDPFCGCQACSGTYSRAYLSHLLKIGDPSAGVMLTIHNLTFLTALMSAIREAIEQQTFEQTFPLGQTLRLL